MNGKKESASSFAALAFVLIALVFAFLFPQPAVAFSEGQGKIYLYGERHGLEQIMDQELELWFHHYHKENMRHLFVELAYYTAEFLNLWMQADDDAILDALYNDWAGTLAHNPTYKEFFKRIKQECPETVFHGTDVGHQYQTTGERFLRYLEAHGLQDTEQYLLTQEAIEQGRHYYRYNDHAYREQMLAKNFIREVDRLKGESIMGIYGSDHTSLNPLLGSIPSMASRLKERYGDRLQVEDLTHLASKPLRVETMVVDGREYTTTYFGRADVSFSKIYLYRDYWRLENAYEDFKDKPKTNDVLPYNNYPMQIEEGQVFVLDYTKPDGTVDRKYYRSDGLVWMSLPSTEEFSLD